MIKSLKQLMRKKIFLSSFYILFLALSIGIGVILTQQKQELRREASGERIDLFFAPPTNPVSIAPNTEFTVDVAATPGNGAKVTATNIVVNFPSYISLVSITPAGFFTYPSNTEMMALGVSCTTVGNCRTTATGVTCTGGFCKTKDANNAVYPPDNTNTQLQFTLGAACTTTTGTGGQCSPQIAGGVLATIKFRSGSSAASGGSISFGSATQATGLDSGGNAITTNIGFPGNAIPVTITGGSTPSPSPTPTPPVSPGAGTAALNFKIKFQGITSQTGNKQVKVTFKNGQVFENINVTSNANGVYSGTVTNIPAGTYEILVKGPVHLQKNLGSVTFAQNETVDKDWSGTILKAGDFDNNNELNIDDISDILVKFTALSVPVNDTNRVFDPNNNGTIDIDDITDVLVNFTSLVVSGDK